MCHFWTWTKKENNRNSEYVVISTLSTYSEVFCFNVSTLILFYSKVESMFFVALVYLINWIQRTKNFPEYTSNIYMITIVKVILFAVVDRNLNI